MFVELLIVGVLVIVTVVMHAAGFGVLLRWLMRSRSLNTSGFWPITRIVIGLTFCLVLVHLVEITIWAFFYFWRGCLPDFETAFYFSGATYTTIGYGDVVLPKPWRVLAPVEGLTGILMCGLSTGLFFAIVDRQINNWLKARTSSEPPTTGAQETPKK